MTARLLLALVCWHTTAASLSGSPPTRAFAEFAKSLTDTATNNAHEEEYMYHFTLPAADDGSNLLFVGRSRDCGTDGCYWTVYYTPKDGEYAKVHEALFLPASALSRSADGERLSYSALLLGGREGNALVSFSVVDGKLKLQSKELTPQEVNVLSDGLVEPPADDSLKTAFKTIESFRKNLVTRSLQRVKLSHILADNESAWQPVEEATRMSQEAVEAETDNATDEGGSAEFPQR